MLRAMKPVIARSDKFEDVQALREDLDDLAWQIADVVKWCPVFPPDFVERVALHLQEGKPL